MVRWMLFIYMLFAVINIGLVFESRLVSLRTLCPVCLVVSYAQYTPPSPRDSTVELRRVGGVNTVRN